MNEHWFPPEEVSRLRASLFDRIARLLEEQGKPCAAAAQANVVSEMAVSLTV